MAAILDRTEAPPIFHTQPWRHQLAAFRAAWDRRAYMLAMEMGTGKSKVAVDLIVNRGHRRTLILCPLSVIDAWERQFELHAGGKVRVLPLSRGTVADRRTQARKAYDEASLNPGQQVAIVINYEAAMRVPFAGFAKQAFWDLILCDESHRIKAPSAAVSRFARSLTLRSAFRLCLSGTPMAHSPLDLWSQFNFLAPAALGRYREFRDRYAIMGGYLEKQVLGFRNTEELQKRFYRLAFRVKAADVLDLPPAVHSQRFIHLGEKASRHYRELEEDFWTEVESGEVTVANALVKLLRLQQVTSGFLPTDNREEVELDGGKRQALGEVFEGLAPGEPIVVFARFRRDLAAIGAAAKEAGRSCGELSGSRNELRSWQAGEKNVLAAQIGAGSEGIDLTRSRYCVFFSLGFSLAQYLQALARTHRPGQTRSVNYIHLLASGTVDQKVYRALEKREQVVESILARSV